MMRTTLVAILGLSFLVVALPAGAQFSGKMPRIGVLTTVGEDESPQLADAFRQGLRELGYVEGQTIAIEWRSAGYRADRMVELAAELVQLKSDIIVAPTNTAVAAAKKATSTIPVVMVYVSEPVTLGFVDSLARPGGNITGLTSQANELAGKRLQLLKEAVPTLTRLAILVDPTEPGRLDQGKELLASAAALKLKAEIVEARSPTQLDSAFATIAQHGVGGTMYGASGMFLAERARIAQLAIKRRLPTLCFAPQYVESGCLMSYSASFPDLWRRAAYFVDRILKGAKPGDLPVEQPTKFRLVINLKTAKALRIPIPPSLMALADEVIP